ncbi:MAG: GHKL domain-containing protein [Blautia wexlerae]
MDNAIEATEKCEEEKVKLRVFFRNINDMFIFKVKNTSIYKPYEKNTKFYTSKQRER